MQSRGSTVHIMGIGVVPNTPFGQIPGSSQIPIFRGSGQGTQIPGISHSQSATPPFGTRLAIWRDWGLFTLTERKTPNSPHPAYGPYYHLWKGCCQLLGIWGTWYSYVVYRGTQRTLLLPHSRWYHVLLVLTQWHGCLHRQHTSNHVPHGDTWIRTPWKQLCYVYYGCTIHKYHHAEHCFYMCTSCKGGTILSTVLNTTTNTNTTAYVSM
jgi:hypothetical protein